ncbi:hypothetical protein [Brachybacterium alimentarium]|uniref:hypothetical protein n=1 Tax=Brachybacterium alimentarium TaxID=47845 RepID=UPI003FCF1364
MVAPLEWYPKRFGPGDMDASGGDHLLGKTELSRLAVVVRETAQNSWDARLPGVRPTFGLSLRRTDFRYREQLVRLLSEGRSSDVAALSRRANLRMLEVFDRGTRGLDGPADLAPPRKDEPARFQDLILKFGVSHNNGTTGGTYGFGKTAAFAYSGVGTVIYWTRCKVAGGVIEDRFIASSFGESYTERGVQFTGRHWWGEVDVDRDSIRPVVGAKAASLGEQFFERRFEEDETGTSLLIIDPLVADAEDSEEESLDRFETAPEVMEADFTRRARHAIRANLWPKLVPAPGSSTTPMQLLLRVAGEDVRLGEHSSGALAHWAAGLTAIRSRRDGSAAIVKSPSRLPVKVFEILRYRKVLGHLALVKRIPDLETAPGDDDLDPALDSESRILRIALMRGQAELIVTTVDWIDREPPIGEDWLAVYKSADDYDRDYAAAEPPAHDSWVTDGSSSESALIVRHTKREVRKFIAAELYPAPILPPPGAERSMLSTGDLARRLGAILPAPAAGEEGVKRPGTGRRRLTGGGARWTVDADAARLLGTDGSGMQRQEIEFQIAGGAPIGRVHLVASLIGEEGQHERMDPADLDIQWIGPQADGIDSALFAVATDGAVRFTGPPRRALRVELTAGGIDGRG